MAGAASEGTLTTDDLTSLEIFTTPSGSIELRVDATHDTIWATQKQIADLFECEKSNVIQHIQHVYAEGEADEAATSKESLLVQTEGAREVRRTATFYNLDVILAVGYRVSGKKATEFRRWTTGVLRSHIEQGYSLNVERISNDPDAQRRLAAEIRAIRTSEASMYGKVRDVFKESASDYQSGSPTAQHFFAMAQDKFHYAVTGKTAAQIILERASAASANLGMRVDVPVRTAEAKVAKNYLTEDELHALENISEQFLLFAESKAFRGQKMTMEELQFKLNTLLTANDYPVLFEYGTYERGRADEHVAAELAKYRQAQIGPA